MPPRFRTLLLAACLLALACLAPAAALADSGGVSPSDARYKAPKKAKIVDGLAVAPRGAPPQVANAIAAANKIVRKPYRYGGGHGSFNDSGYDCSGSVSYALHGGGLLRSPLDSSSFMHWGVAGKGKWITIYTNPGHAYVYIAGLRLDTGQRIKASGAKPGSGPRWNYGARSNSGFTARHPNGF
jgi:cell wall-associated NlpC family hydrolase